MLAPRDPSAVRGDDVAIKNDQSHFAARVLALYRAALDGKSDTVTESDIDVCAVAFGLAALRQAIDERKVKYDSLRLAQAGIYQASDILEALTSGEGHAIWKFIDGIKTSRRPQRARSNNASERLLFGGVTLAYASGVNVSERAAAMVVAEKIRWENRQVSIEQIRGWIRRDRQGCQEVAKQILNKAERGTPIDVFSGKQIPLSERVLCTGRQEIFDALGSIPVASAPSPGVGQ